MSANLENSNGEGTLNPDVRNDVNNEKLTLVTTNHRLNVRQEERYRRVILTLTCFSIIATSTFGISAIVYSIKDTSSSTFALGLDAILDTLSSFVVAWRYIGASIYSESKERIACVSLGVLFILSAAVACGNSLFSLLTPVLPAIDVYLVPLSIATGTILGVFAAIKLYLGYMMESRALITDAFNSFIGTVMGYGCAVSFYVYQHNPDIWFLDSSLGIVCSVILFAYGFWLLVAICCEIPAKS